MSKQKNMTMTNLILTTFLLILTGSYVNNTSNENYDTLNNSIESPIKVINESGSSVATRFNTPKGFERVITEKGTWAYHLQNLPLKPNGSQVKHYDGTLKSNTNAYIAVVDLPIGKKNLHQCADAVIRLRADYLYSQGRFDEIEFLFASGKKSKYLDWIGSNEPNQKNYWTYLENVFNYASTYSLDKQLKSKNVRDLQIGDVFIRGGAPGHTVIVVDKCVNSKGKVKFMLAQSYMPAQETQILTNPNELDTPWYDLDFGDHIYTSEYIFTKKQLKTF